jgi:hypothetical protein
LKKSPYAHKPLTRKMMMKKRKKEKKVEEEEKEMKMRSNWM